MSNKFQKINKISELSKRLDNKAKILYVAYKKGKLDINKLNDDMQRRIKELEKNDRNYIGLLDKYNKKKNNLKTENIVLKFIDFININS